VQSETLAVGAQPLAQGGPLADEGLVSNLGTLFTDGDQPDDGARWFDPSMSRRLKPPSESLGRERATCTTIPPCSAQSPRIQLAALEIHGLYSRYSLVRWASV
jgi:hypothetical protein